jgi:PAB-dependent poly(A)-specific ribonuclease subunit 2
MRRRAPTIDSQLLANRKMHQFVGHARKPAHLRRNQVPYDLQRESRATVPESPMMRETNPLSLIPKPYRQVEIKYSKLGIETFDFAHYNDTKFAGLEIHIPNAYCNSMLQVLYFIEPLRHAFLNHLCSKEFCLACELHFLFLMLDSSTGRSCQATNFLRAFRTLREASALGLLISRGDEEQKADLGKLIQNWSRFVLQQLHQVSRNREGDILSPVGLQETQPELASLDGGGSRSSVVERLFGCAVASESVCRCGWSSSRTHTELLFSLTCPPSVGGEEVSFGTFLEASLCRKQKVHAWCDSCSKFTPTTSERSVCTLPLVLSLNCQVEGENEREFWRQQQTKAAAQGGSWVPHTLTISLAEGGRVSVREGPDEKDGVVYELSMVVAHVKEGWMEAPGNLVAHIRVSPFYHERKKIPRRFQWYLFNDFAITPASQSSVAQFSLEWLTPCLLLYTQRDFSTQFPHSPLLRLEPSVLLAETHSPRPLQSPTVHTSLSFHELPERGDLVGIDAEFVTLNQV